MRGIILKNDRLFLIDGMAFAFYITIRADTRESDESCMVYAGVAEDHPGADPSHVAVVFDAPGKTFRDEMYADYSDAAGNAADLKAQF